MENKAVMNYACKSCSQEYNGNYCPKCGQKKIEKRLVLKDSIGHLLGVVVNFERGLWYTSIMMYKNPGKVVKDYLKGVTRPYIHPFRFLFIWLSVSLFLMFSTGLYDDLQTQMAENFGQQQNPIGERVNTVIQKYMQVFFVVSIPFLAFGSKMVFKKAKFNFAEHLVINSFCYGASLVLAIAFTPFYFLSLEFAGTVQLISVGVNIAVQTYFYKRIFGENILPSIFKSIFSYVFWIIGFFLIAALFFIGYLIYWAFSDPESLKEAAKVAEHINPELIAVFAQLV